MLACWLMAPMRTSARAEIGDGFDLHQDFRPAQEIALLRG
jgi:hypothetical protein